MRHRSTEHRHHRVTDELLHRPAVPPRSPPEAARDTDGSRARTSSGSCRSDAAVNPTRSQNNTDTTFRSSSEPERSAARSAAPCRKDRTGTRPEAPRRKQGRTPPAESKTLRHFARSGHTMRGMADAVAAKRSYGGQTMVEPLRRVLLRRPPADVSDWRRFGWRAKPDPVKLAEEHEQLCLQLEDAGAEVVVAPATTLDAIYAFDPALVADRGAVLLRPGKPERADEVDAAAAEPRGRGRPGRSPSSSAPAHAEGGDLAWLDERTLLAGRSYRTSADGILAARADPRDRDARLRPAPLPRTRRGPAPPLAAQPARPRPRRRLHAADAGPPRAAPGRARDRDRRGAGRRVRDDGSERARPRPRAARSFSSATSRRGGASNAPASHVDGLPGRRAVQGRRRPDLPDAAAPPGGPASGARPRSPPSAAS